MEDELDISNQSCSSINESHTDLNDSLISSNEKTNRLSTQI